MRWDLVDKFDVLKKGEYAKASKKFSGSEDFFTEHFPGKPIVPEPLFIEMVAQVGGVLFGLGLDFKKEVILAKITESRFLKAVSPPCSFVIEAKVEDEREDGAWIVGTVMSGGKLISESRLLLVAIAGLGQNDRKIVFNDHFLKHYDVYQVAKLSEVLS